MGTGHALDADTYALWRMTEEGSSLIDEAGRFPLTAISAAAYASSVPGQVGNARDFPGKASYYFKSAGTLGAPAAAVLSGEITLEAVVWLRKNRTVTACLLTASAYNETEGGNGLLGLQVTTDGFVYTFWEYGAGVNVTSTTSVHVQDETRVHLAWVRRLEAGGATMAIDIYLNGVLAETVTGLSKPTGGSSGYMYLGSDSGDSQWLSGTLEEVRLSNTARTSAEIQASYDACFPEIVATPGPAPEIGNFDPAVGTEITPSTAIAFDLTAAGGFRETVLVVSYSSGERELAFDGQGFAPAFAAGSSRVDIAGGSRFVLARAGGWPAPPTLVPYAIDTSGQEVP